MGRVGGGPYNINDWRKWVHALKPGPRDFAATPGVGNCLAKMLIGCFCSTRPIEASYAKYGDALRADEPLVVACTRRPLRITTGLVKRAQRKVENLAFVGLQEFYNASVCLFHHMYGGEPLPYEFSLFNVGNAHATRHRSEPPLQQQPQTLAKGPASTKHWRYSLVKDQSMIAALQSRRTFWSYDEAPLQDFVDLTDEYIYETGILRFEKDLMRVLADKARERERERSRDPALHNLVDLIWAWHRREHEHTRRGQEK